jgi:hypothetical protein
MKNVDKTPSRMPTFRVPMQGAPPPKGWFVRYLSGMEEEPDIRPGFWLSQWSIDSKSYIIFTFEPVMDLHWDTEAQADEVSKALRESAGIETAVVKVGF